MPSLLALSSGAALFFSILGEVAFGVALIRQQSGRFEHRFLEICLTLSGLCNLVVLFLIRQQGEGLIFGNLAGILLTLSLLLMIAALVIGRVLNSVTPLYALLPLAIACQAVGLCPHLYKEAITLSTPLLVHIALVSLAYLHLFVGTTLAWMGLLVSRRLRQHPVPPAIWKWPSMDLCDRAAYRTVSLGVILLSLAFCVALLFLPHQSQSFFEIGHWVAIAIYGLTSVMRMLNRWSLQPMIAGYTLAFLIILASLLSGGHAWN